MYEGMTDPPRSVRVLIYLHYQDVQYISTGIDREWNRAGDQTASRARPAKIELSVNQWGFCAALKIEPRGVCNEKADFNYFQF